MRVRKDLTERLELGLKRYKHGVRVNDDTRMWGTSKNSWIDIGFSDLNLFLKSSRSSILATVYLDAISISSALVILFIQDELNSILVLSLSSILKI